MQLLHNIENLHKHFNKYIKIIYLLENNILVKDVENI